MRVSEVVARPNLCLLPVQQSFIEHQCIFNKDNYAFLTIIIKSLFQEGNILSTTAYLQYGLKQINNTC